MDEDWIHIVLTMICSGVFSVRLYMWYALTWVENSLYTAAMQEFLHFSPSIQLFLHPGGSGHLGGNGARGKPHFQGPWQMD